MVKLIDKARELTSLYIRNQEKSGATRTVFFQVEKANEYRNEPGKI